LSDQQIAATRRKLASVNRVRLERLLLELATAVEADFAAEQRRLSSAATKPMLATDGMIGIQPILPRQDAASTVRMSGINGPHFRRGRGRIPAPCENVYRRILMALKTDRRADVIVKL